MNSLHSLVMQGKVLYLVSENACSQDLGAIALTSFRPGRFRHPRMGRLEGKQLRSHGEQDTLRHLPGSLERARARLRARDPPHDPR